MTAKSKPNPAQNGLILIAGSLAIAALAYQFGIKPSLETAKQSEQQAIETEKKIEENRALINRLPELKAENERLTRELTVIRNEFPRIESLPSRIDTLESNARALGLSLGNITRKVQESGVSGIDKMTLSTTIQGPYPNTAELFRRILADDRFASIDTIIMKRQLGLTTQADISYYMMRQETATPDTTSPTTQNSTPDTPTPGDARRAANDAGGNP